MRRPSAPLGAGGEQGGTFFCLHALLAVVSTGDELARLLLLAYCTRIRERD
jgi:hypothetical protein